MRERGGGGALLTKAAAAKVLRTSRVRADTTVVPAIVCYPIDSGLLAKAIRRIGTARSADPQRGAFRASSTGRDSWGVTVGVWARCGGNGWGECGGAIGTLGWGILSMKMQAVAVLRWACAG